ncbi:ATP-binding protein, partial [Salinifilum aidingensis]
REAERRQLRTDFQLVPSYSIGGPALLERIAGNLLENAVRHNVDGGWIEAVTQPGQRWTTLRVRSSGGLVDPATVAELFEPFRREGVARTARTGAGLGAVIATRSDSAGPSEAGGMRLVAGTYRLDDRIGAWTALGASGAGRLSGGGQAAQGAATGNTKVCLAATTDGHA